MHRLGLGPALDTHIVRQGAAGTCHAQAVIARSDDLAKQLATECKAKRRASLVANRLQLPDGLLRRHDAAGDGLCDEAADRVDPQSPLLAKAALYLVDHRSQGYYWESTQQTAMVIYGLTDYLQHTQELKPNFSVDVKVNGKSVGPRSSQPPTRPLHQRQSRSLKRNSRPRTNQVRLVKSGEGRLYWSARGEYYSSQPNVVNSGDVPAERVRQYYKLTPQQNGDKVMYHLDKLLWPGAGRRHAGRAHHGRRQRVAVPDDRRPDSLRHRVDRARRSLSARRAAAVVERALAQLSRIARRSHHVLQLCGFRAASPNTRICSRW